MFCRLEAYREHIADLETKLEGIKRELKTVKAELEREPPEREQPRTILQILEEERHNELQRLLSEQRRDAQHDMDLAAMLITW